MKEKASAILMWILAAPVNVNPPATPRTVVTLSSKAQPQTVIVPSPAQYILPPQLVPAIKSTP